LGKESRQNIQYYPFVNGFASKKRRKAFGKWKCEWFSRYKSVQTIHTLQKMGNKARNQGEIYNIIHIRMVSHRKRGRKHSENGNVNGFPGINLFKPFTRSRKWEIRPGIKEEYTILSICEWFHIEKEEESIRKMEM
jgi:hypothetical protein